MVAQQENRLCLMVARGSPSRSMTIVSRRASIFLWMSMSTRPCVSFNSNVSLMRMALPSTRNTLLPFWSSIQ